MKERTIKFELTAVADMAPIEQVTNSLSLDSVRVRQLRVSHTTDELDIEGTVVAYVQQSQAPDWSTLDVDCVVDATGRRTQNRAAQEHIQNGATRVILTAPSDDADQTVIVGYNSEILSESWSVISLGSCTTNCLVSMLRPLELVTTVRSCLVSTIHSYTADQRLVDSMHSDPRRSRGAAINIIPTTTGAATAAGKVLNYAPGRIDGRSFRVPVANVSALDATLLLDDPLSVEELNSIFIHAAEGSQVLAVENRPVVSSDMTGAPFSAVIDLGLTQIATPMVKVVAWYDNEWGYANRIVDGLNALANQ